MALVLPQEQPLGALVIISILIVSTRCRSICTSLWRSGRDYLRVLVRYSLISMYERMLSAFFCLILSSILSIPAQPPLRRDQPSRDRVAMVHVQGQALGRGAVQTAFSA